MKPLHLFCISLLLCNCYQQSDSSDNLIVNPGFENIVNSNPTGWEVVSSNKAKIFEAGISKQSHNGNHAMMFGRAWADSWEMNGFKTAAPVPINPDHKYLLSFWYKTLDIKEYPMPLGIRLKIHRKNEVHLRYHKNISTRDDWTQVNWLLDTLPPDAVSSDIEFLLWIRTKGKVVIDDVKFKIADKSDIQKFYEWRTLPEQIISEDFAEPNFPVTGFYDVKKNGPRWWLVNPHGKPTWSIAAMGEIPGQSENGNVLLAEWFQVNYQNNRLEYAKMQYDLLESWGINSFAGWTAEEYAVLTEERYNNGKNFFPIYRVLNFSIMGADKDYYARNSKGEQKGVHDHSFPDPFNPEWRKDARNRASEKINKYKGKSWFAGWFMDNEIDYSSLFEYVWGDYSAIEFINYLEGKYTDISMLNEIWSSDFNQYNYASFDDILLNKPSPVEWDDPLYPDFIAFERIMMEEYINYTYNMVKELDPDHLIISNRLNLGPMMSLHRTIDLWAKYDVVCVNIYPENLYFGFDKGELEILEWIYKKTNTPIIIGEWSIPAMDSQLYKFGEDPLDRHLDWSWPQVVRNQKERGEIYHTCMMQLASKPYILGAAWFKVLDVNSSTRRANRGLINSNHQPYTEFIEIFRKTNQEIKNKMNISR